MIIYLFHTFQIMRKFEYINRFKDYNSDFYKDWFNKYTWNHYDKDGYDMYGHDKEWFDKNWWNYQLLNKKTWTKFDENGFDYEWYDKDWYDKNKWDKRWINKDTWIKFDIKWFNKMWRNSDWINKITKTKFDKNWFNIDWYDKDGYDKFWFNYKRYNKKTWTKFDENWFDYEWYDKNWYNEEGRNKMWFNNRSLNEKYYNQNGYDYYSNDNENGYDYEWYSTDYQINLLYSFDDKHWNSAYKYYDINWYDKKWYNENWWNRWKINKYTWTRFDKEWYDINGLDKNGYNRDWRKIWFICTATGNEYDENGYDYEWYDEYWYDKDWVYKYYKLNIWLNEQYHIIHERNYFKENKKTNWLRKWWYINKETWTFYDKNWYDKDWYNIYWYDEFWFQKSREYRQTWKEYDENGYDYEWYDQNWYDENWYNKMWYDKNWKKRKDSENSQNWYLWESISIEKFLEYMHSNNKDKYDKHGFDKYWFYQSNSLCNEKWFLKDWFNIYTKDVYDIDWYDINWNPMRNRRYWIKYKRNTIIDKINNDTIKEYLYWADNTLKIFFFDTETTWTDPISDYIIQFWWIYWELNLNNRKFRELERINQYIKVPITIPESASIIHWIYNEDLIWYDYIDWYIESFLSYILKADFVVWHNIDFDRSMILWECARLWINFTWENVKRIDTMKPCTNLVKIPKYWWYSGYKWPKLIELYRFLFKKDFEWAHDALADIEATKECFIELCKKYEFYKNWYFKTSL